MDFGKLIPQVFFDILARSVPGTVVLGAWILLFGSQAWPSLLNAMLGGYLDSSNVVAVASLAFLFLTYLIGQILSLFAKRVQRVNEWQPMTRNKRGRMTTSRGLMRINILTHRFTGSGSLRSDVWVVALIKRHTPRVYKIDGVGKSYDWLRAHHADAGALCAKIRAEFLMYDALAVAFIVVTVMLLVRREWLVSAGTFVLIVVTWTRGADTEETYQKTVGQFYTAFSGPLASTPAAT